MTCYIVFMKNRERKGDFYGIACTAIFPCHCKRTEHCKSSGIPAFVSAYIFGPVDHAKYNSIPLSYQNTWGVLMRKDSPLAEKQEILPEVLWDKPLIISRQYSAESWLQREFSELEIIATYNLLFNTSLMVEEGLGYAIGFDKIINTSGNSALCFRPFSPKREEGMGMVWKKYQVLSKASEKFMEKMKELLAIL